MAESFLKLEDIKLILKRRRLNYKLKDRKVKDCDGNYLTFFDVHSATYIRGKIVKAFNEGEVYHWPVLNHQNLAPLIDVLYIREDLSIFLTPDLQVTLKEIIHDEDFVYDRRCFDRKRLYAKDIFSGLSYLHGKSLCLMNLTDDNIAVCKIYDKAVITNFSCLVCSRKTTRSKMKVPEVYKSPESEKGEFDAIAAEIWASGTLMLDMFLAHMVPWAVIDYKPKRVIEIVEKLSLELLQAANVGSTVTAVDLAKYKTFLKCFFRQNPVARISARFASIASFLQPNLQDMERMDCVWCIDSADKTTHPNAKLVNRDVKRERFISNNPDFRDFLTQYPPIGSNHKSLAPPKYSDSKNICKDLMVYRNQPDVSKCATSNSGILCLPEVNERLSPIECAGTVNSALDGKRSEQEEFKKIDDKTGASKETTSVNICRQEEGNQLTEFPSPFFYESDNSFTVPQTNVVLKDSSKSCQIIADEKNDVSESSYICYQSKSLSCIKSTKNDNAAYLKFCSNRTFSYSNIRSASNQQLSTSDMWNSDLCLDRLFEENDLPGIDVSKTRDQNAFQLMKSRDIRGATKSRGHKPYTHMTHASFADSHKRPASKSERLQRNNRNQCELLNELDLPEIWNQIKFIRSCQITLRNHSRLFISTEFNYKQQKLLHGYKNLLHEEFLRLRRILEEKYQLRVEDLVELHRSFSSVSKNAENKQESLPQSRNKNISFMASQYKALPPGTIENTLQRNVDNTKNYSSKFVDTNISPKIRLRRKYSYYRAIEMSSRNAGRKWKNSEVNERLEQAKSVFSKQNYSKDQLIEQVPKINGQALKVISMKRKLGNTTLKPSKAITEIKPETRDRMEENRKDSSKCKKERISKNNTERDATTEKKDKVVKDDKEEKITPEEKNGEKERKGEIKVNVKYDHKLPTGKGNREEQKNKKEKCLKKKKDDKKLPKPKRESEMKSSFFFSLCPGGRVEEPTPILDNLCETCKLNLEMP